MLTAVVFKWITITIVARICRMIIGRVYDFYHSMIVTIDEHGHIVLLTNIIQLGLFFKICQ